VTLSELSPGHRQGLQIQMSLSRGEGSDGWRDTTATA
jgi:hypothetical protein